MKLSLLLVPLMLAIAGDVSAQTVTPVLTICKAAYRAPNATYRATVKWNEPLIYYPGGQLVVGMADTSKAVYIQGLHGTPFDARGTDTATFTVADSSLYPLDTAIYSLSPTAYRNYQATCKATKQCFFSATGDGVHQVSNVVRLTSAVATKNC